MKKPFLFTLLLAASLYSNAQDNTLLTADFWRGKPNLQAVQAEITKGNNPSEQNAGFHDPVTMAINNRVSNDIIKYLIEQEGNDVHKKTHHSRTYLQWAASAGNLEIVNYLIDKGADVNYKDSYGESVIAFASTGNKNIEVFEALFQKGIDPKSKHTDGKNLIMYAIAGDTDLKVTEYFISKGISLDDKDDFGRTVADYAARYGNLEIIDKLIEKGVHPTDHALFMATLGSRQKQNGKEVYQQLISKYKLNPAAVNPEGETLLHILVRRANKEVIDYIATQANIDFAKSDKQGNTILMNAAAVAAQDASIIDLLLTKADNINAKNENGETALSQAVATGSPAIVNLLIKKGADATIKDNDGNNLAYHWFNAYRPNPRQASDNSLSDNFQEKQPLLKAAGVDFTSKQKDGNTLFHIAVEKQNIELIQKASELGVDINAQDEEGNTALHKAALIAKDDIILKKLIELGAKKDLTTEFEETAYQLAQENNFLIENNISIDFLK